MASEMELGEEVGDSSTNLLANYQRHARELLRSALLEQHGALSTTEKGVPELKRRKEKLLSEQIETAVELELRRQLSIEPLGSISISDDEAHVDTVRLRLKALEKEILSVKSDYVKNCRLLECLHQGHALKEKVFYGENRDIHESLDKTFSGKGCNDFRGPVTTDSDTARQLSQQSEVTGELLGELGKIKEIRSELLSVRRERRELQQQSRELMKTVQNSKRSQTPVDSGDDGTENESTKEGGGDRRRLHRAEIELCLLRHTLQGLIAGSGVPWSQDSELLELTLKLGDDQQWR